MWLQNLMFTLLIIAACTPALLWGGWEGRLTCVTFICAGLSTTAMIKFFQASLGVPAATVMVDALLALVLLLIAVRTDRYWPIWIFAFHGLSILTYIAWHFSPVRRVDVFDSIASFWSLPELVMLCIGPMLDAAWARRQEAVDDRHSPSAGRVA